MMTEAEAREKWCPMVRLTADQDEWKNNRGDFPGKERSFNCIASDCAMWRWVTTLDSGTVINTDKGYCGLGGRP